jgi:hypothetical protein
VDIAIDRARRGDSHKQQLRVVSRIGPRGRGFNGRAFIGV